MSTATVKARKTRTPEKPEQRNTRPVSPNDKPTWETPTMEDVSQQVMAQPYIRFT